MTPFHLAPPAPAQPAPAQPTPTQPTPVRAARRVAAAVAGAGLLAGVLTAGPAGVETAAATTTVVSGTAVAKATVRAAAAGTSPSLGSLQRGQRISTTAPAEHGWVRVRFARGTGYVAAKWLNTTGRGLPAGPTTIGTSGVKVATAALNLRRTASAKATVLRKVPEGAPLVLTGRQSHRLAETRWSGRTGWVSVRYLAAAHRGVAALASARLQLGKPYVYGAAGPQGYDCSGLTSAAWAAAGVAVPRTSQQQFVAGTRVSQADLEAGDLVFFFGTSPSHVGMYVGDGQVIHAPRTGRNVEYAQLASMPFSGARRPG